MRKLYDLTDEDRKIFHRVRSVVMKRHPQVVQAGKRLDTQFTTDSHDRRNLDLQGPIDHEKDTIEPSDPGDFFTDADHASRFDMAWGVIDRFSMRFVYNNEMYGETFDDLQSPENLNIAALIIVLVWLITDPDARMVTGVTCFAQEWPWDEGLYSRQYKRDGLRGRFDRPDIERVFAGMEDSEQARKDLYELKKKGIYQGNGIFRPFWIELAEKAVEVLEAKPDGTEQHDSPAGGGRRRGQKPLTEKQIRERFKLNDDWLKAKGEKVSLDGFAADRKEINKTPNDIATIKRWLNWCSKNKDRRPHL